MFLIAGHKKSRDISRYNYICLGYMKIFMHLFHYFSRNPERCSVELLRFRITQAEKRLCILLLSISVWKIAMSCSPSFDVNN